MISSAGKDMEKTASASATRAATASIAADKKKLAYFYGDCVVKQEFGDLILPDTTYLERYDAMSMLDRPISEYDGPVDSVRIPVLPPKGECKPFQDVIVELGSRLKLPSFTKEDGTRKFKDYKDLVINFETAPGSGIGFLAGWRGKSGEKSMKGEANPNQWEMYEKKFIPKEFEDEIRGKNIKDQIYIATLPAQGYEPDEDEWQDIVDAPDYNSVSAKVREIKGKEPTRSALLIFISEDGTLSAQQEGEISTITINCEELLNTCFELIHKARMKAPRPTIQIYIVLPALQARALHYYLARRPEEAMSVFGAPVWGNYLFGAKLLTSEIIEEPIVY